MISEAAILSFLLAQPVNRHDLEKPPGDREETFAMLAHSIRAAAKTDREVALQLTIARHEAGNSVDVIRGDCSALPKGSCDWDAKAATYRARGFGQLHEGTCPKAWSLPAGSQESLDAEAVCVVELLRWGYQRCERRHQDGHVGMWGVYAGRDSCSWGGGFRACSDHEAHRARAPEVRDELGEGR